MRLPGVELDRLVIEEVRLRRGWDVGQISSAMKCCRGLFCFEFLEVGLLNLSGFVYDRGIDLG